MKKYIVLNLFMVFVSLTLKPNRAFAQVKFLAGPISGFGVSTFHGNYYGDYKPHVHIGLITSIQFNDKLHLQPTALFSTKGYFSSVIKPDEKVKLQYFNLITTLKYQPVEILFVGGGMYAGWLYHSEYSYFAYGTDYYGEPDISGIVNTFDYGLSGSIGCQFKNGIGFEVSLHYGLQDVFNEHSTDTLVGYSGLPYVIPSEAKGKNTVISTSFYFLIGSKDF